MEIKTELCINHAELLKLFFKANELEQSVKVRYYDKDINGIFHKMIVLVCEAPGQSTLTYMALRHSGIENMLEHFLLACGVEPDALKPASYHRQEQDERERELNTKLMKRIYGENFKEEMMPTIKMEPK